MHNPDNIVVDVAEMRDWLVAYKNETGLSWGAIAHASGMAKGTLSSFAVNSYAGNEQNIAKQLYRFRQLLETQAERAVGVPTEPSFLDMPTARRLRYLLIRAHRGRMTYGATGPGTCKTLTMEDYAASVANVWTATMDPTTKSLAAMIAVVLRAVGGDPRQGWIRQMSAQVKGLVAGRQGLLVIDEANHLDYEALEQLRAWHDATGVGICLLGNEELDATIRGGTKRHAFARLNSRIAMRHVQDLPLEEDVEIYLDAWNIKEPAQRKMLKTIGLTSGAGGLREIKYIIEDATMLALDDEMPLSLGYLREAQSTRATKFIRVAA